MANNICQTCKYKNGCEDYCDSCCVCGDWECEQPASMDWNEAIKQWKIKHIEKYGKGETQVREHDSHYGFRIVSIPYIELPEQGITIEYNSKPLIHVNGDYKPGCIKKVMAKTFTGKGKKRIEVEEIES